MFFPHSTYRRCVTSIFDGIGNEYNCLACLGSNLKKICNIFTMQVFCHDICTSHFSALLTLFEQIFKMYVAVCGLKLCSPITPHNVTILWLHCAPRLHGRSNWVQYSLDNLFYHMYNSL